MDIDVNEIDLTQQPAWDDYLENSGQGSLYHTYAVRQVLQRALNVQSHYLTARSDNRIVGLLPLVRLNLWPICNMLTSMPYFNYGGIVADDDTARWALLEHARQLAEQQNVDHVELRHSADIDSLPSRTDKVAMLLKLEDDPAVQLKVFGSKLRAQIKRPQREGAETKIGGIELLADFYDVFAVNMRDLGTPVYSKRFFAELLSALGKVARIAVVYLNQQPVASGLVLGHRNTLEIPWASSLRSANKFSVNMALYWSVIEFAIEQGYETFDFGRCSEGSGTHRFKRQWGAQASQLYWHYLLPEDRELPRINPDNPKYSLLVRNWQRLPLSIANRVGPLLSKNLP